jgi:hypothetical protein
MKPKNSQKWGNDYNDIQLMPFQNLVSKPREPERQEPVMVRQDRNKIREKNDD